MRLHSDILTRTAVLAALNLASHDTPEDHFGVMISDLIDHGSRIRDHAFEIALEGYGERHTRARAWGVPQRGKGDQTYTARAASYDDWGYFIARIFDKDPAAVFGPYKGRDDFDAQTRYKFCIDADGDADGFPSIVTTVAPEPFEVIAVGTYDPIADRLVLAAFTGDPR
jgi:hypothetical protein